MLQIPEVDSQLSKSFEEKFMILSGAHLPRPKQTKSLPHSESCIPVFLEVGLCSFFLEKEETTDCQMCFSFEGALFWLFLRETTRKTTNKTRKLMTSAIFVGSSPSLLAGFTPMFLKREMRAGLGHQPRNGPSCLETKLNLWGCSPPKVG